MKKTEKRETVYEQDNIKLVMTRQVKTVTFRVIVQALSNTGRNSPIDFTLTLPEYTAMLLVLNEVDNDSRV